MKTNKQRKITNTIMVSLMLVAAIITLIPLISIFVYVITRGAGSLNLAFFTHLPAPVGEKGGGMANAIVGTLQLVGLACAWAVPVGILGGVYLAESQNRKTVFIIRALADVLTGVPSIVTGIFAYAIFVVPMKGFSALSGGFALGFMMLPMVVRTTEEMVLRVPHTLREAALALGIGRYQTTVQIILRTAKSGILTGVLLSLSRIAGETAPLLFTAFGNHYWNQSLHEPIAALPLQIFNYAISPFEEWHRQAWAGALVLIAMIFSVTLISRFVVAQNNRFSRQG